MKKRSWITALFLLILSSIALIVRIYYVNRLMAEVNISEDIYNAAKVSIGTNGLTSAFTGGFRIRSLYICNLYLAFLIFGNFTVSGVYLNILYQVLTVMLVYIVVKNLTNRYIGFAGSLILAILPIYISTLSEVTIQNMEILIAVLCSTIVISIIQWIYHRHTAKKSVSNKMIANKADSEKVEKSNLDSNNAFDANMNILPDTSMKEIRYDDLEDNKVQYIENPLPVPKRREHKEMDYAFEPTGSDEDYDVNDLAGKDFYDIE
ncbi:MAG: glycosyltransferase family 39 protein [Lachnospiraceae bacterium]|nr:glycosyltransferase family 39 protein [Lachnospiraceae bacterium]MDE7203311.1 glycosyltransferase family 39 protein [Lachnospiraceae bacterium]